MMIMNKIATNALSGSCKCARTWCIFGNAGRCEGSLGVKKLDTVRIRKCWSSLRKTGICGVFSQVNELDTVPYA